jgi:hypothetical protein
LLNVIDGQFCLPSALPGIDDVEARTIAVQILSKQSQTANTKWSFYLGYWMKAIQLLNVQKKHVANLGWARFFVKPNDVIFVCSDIKSTYNLG